MIYCDKLTANSLKYYVCPILSEIGMRRQIVVESKQYVILRLTPLGHWDQQSIWAVLVYLSKCSVGFTWTLALVFRFLSLFFSGFNIADSAGRNQMYCSIHWKSFPLFVAAETQFFTLHRKKISPSTVVMWLFHCFCYVIQEGGKPAPERITGTLFRKHQSI